MEDLEFRQKIEDLVTKLTPLDSCPVKADATKQRRVKLVNGIIRLIVERDKLKPYSPPMEYK